MMGSFAGRRNQYIQLAKVLYCKLPTIGKQLSTFPHKVQGLNCRPQRFADTYTFFFVSCQRNNIVVTH